MLPEFSDAAFAMKKGETSSKPVKTQYGYHVIQFEGRRQGLTLLFGMIHAVAQHPVAHHRIEGQVGEQGVGLTDVSGPVTARPAPAGGAGVDVGSPDLAPARLQGGVVVQRIFTAPDPQDAPAQGRQGGDIAFGHHPPVGQGPDPPRLG